MKKIIIISSFLFNFISFNSLGQNIISNFKFQEGTLVIETHVCLDNSAIIILTKDASNNYRFYNSAILNKDGVSPAVPIESLNEYLTQGTEIKGFCLSADNSTIYFSSNMPGGLGGFDIYKSNKNNSNWGKPENVGKPVNSITDEFEPSISSDRNSLYLTRSVTEENDFTDDFACKKIYLAEKNIEGNWEKPKELTKPINLYCECRPIIAPDNKTLYFSSVREDNDKGFEIMYTKIIAKNIWKTPILIDTLSSEYDDLSLSFPITKNFYLINRLPANRNKRHPYQVVKTTIPKQFQHDDVQVVEGKIKDLFTNNPLEAQIDVSHPKTKRIIAQYSSQKNTGKYYIVLPKGQAYDISVHKKNYSYYFTHYDVQKIKKTKTIQKDFMLYKSISLFLNVFDAEDFSPLDAEIKIKSNDNTIVKSPVTKERLGRYILNLEIGKKYTIRVEAKNHLAYEIPFSLEEIVQYNNFEKDVELAPTYEDIQFDVTDMETENEIDSVEVIITDEETGIKTKIKTKKNKDGKYVLKLKKGKKYKVKVKAPKGYAFFNTKLDMTKEAPKKMDVKLEPLNAKTKLTFNNIQFETNSADMDVNSFSELESLIELMKDNPNIKVEISAHTDDVGSEAYNLRLSEKRAESVVKYLIENKVNKNQLIAKGYGESKPKVANDSDENRAKNRRVELKILDVNIKE